MAPGRLGAVYLSAFATRLWSPWRQEACPLHHCTLRVGTGGFSVKHLWPTASVREGLRLLRRGRCCLQIWISHHRFTVNPESLCFPPLVVNHLEKRVWESHSDSQHTSCAGVLVSTCRGWWTGFWHYTPVTSPTFFPASLCFLLHTQSMGQERSHSGPGTPQASILSLQVSDRDPGFETTNLGFSLVWACKPTRERTSITSPSPID